MNVELFKDAIAIIAGIPYKQVSLRNWQKDMHPFRSRTVHQTHRIDCGTVCCAAGWLALHPDMRKLGLRNGALGEPVLKRKGHLYDLEDYDALAELFGIDYKEAMALFGPGISEQERPNNENDKVVWLNRARKLLAKYEAANAS
jgi:hypothetical protein